MISNDRAHRRIGRLQQRRGSLHVHAFRDLSDLQNGVNLPNIANLENYTALIEALESRGLNGNRVFADADGRRTVLAVIISADLSDGIRSHMREPHDGAAYGRLALVQDGTHNYGIANLLSKQCRARKEKNGS